MTATFLQFCCRRMVLRCYIACIFSLWRYFQPVLHQFWIQYQWYDDGDVNVSTVRLPTNDAAVLHCVHLVWFSHSQPYLHHHHQHHQPIFWIQYYSYDDHDDDHVGTVLLPTIGAAVSHRVRLLIVVSFTAPFCSSIINIIIRPSVYNISVTTTITATFLQFCCRRMMLRCHTSCIFVLSSYSQPVFVSSSSTSSTDVLYHLRQLSFRIQY